VDINVASMAWGELRVDARVALAETCIVPGECIPDVSQGYHRCKPCVPVA